MHVPGTVILASWLDAKGFSYDLQQRYKKSEWLESIGVGAFIRPNENVNWQGAVYSLQKQANLQVHIGGLTALSLLGYSHYLRSGVETIYLFSKLKTKLPAWFEKYSWSEPITHIKTSFLPSAQGYEEFNQGVFQIKIASPERAILECLYLTPDILDILEAYQILSGLVNLRPELMQSLLIDCKSVKVKRLFLYMLKKANHQWGQFLDTSKVLLGTGDREVVKNGKYDSEFHITVPKELARL